MDYPSDELLLSPPDEFIFKYVASTYLNGFINYVKPLKFLTHQAYIHPGDKEYTSKEEVIAYHKEKFKNYHSKLHDTEGFNYLIIAESKNHNWYFYYDQDCSDCAIARWRRPGYDEGKPCPVCGNREHIGSATITIDPDSFVPPLTELPITMLKGWIGY